MATVPHSNEKVTEVNPSAGEADDLEADLPTRHMLVNFGPSHPAMHGTVRMALELDGETIVKAEPEIGFLHRGFEKSCENSTWTQCLPYTDRLNYVSAMMNNFGYLHAVEKLLGHRDPRARQVHPHHRRRDAPHVRPPHARGRHGAGAGWLHRVPLRRRGARAALGPRRAS